MATARTDSPVRGCICTSFMPDKMPDNNTANWIVDQLMPTGEVHLIAGPSGSGKTTWLLQFLNEWSNGRPILDYDSFPRKWAYVACDRSIADVERTMSRIGVKFPGVMIDSMVDNINIQTIDDVLARMATAEVEFLVLEGIGSIVPGGKINDYECVATFLKHLTRWCGNRSLDPYSESGWKQGQKRTILGTTHSPKMKEKDVYTLGRDRVIGTTAWGAFSNTVFTLEQIVEKDNKGKAAGGDGKRIRRLTVMPRNAKNFEVDYSIASDGSLLLYSPTEGQNLEFWISNYLETIGEGGKFTRKGMITFLMNSDVEIEESLISKVMSKLVKEKVVLATTRGVYTKLKDAGEPVLELRDSEEDNENDSDSDNEKIVRQITF